MSNKTIVAMVFAVVISSVIISGCVGQPVANANQPAVFTSVDEIKTYLKENVGNSYSGYGSAMQTKATGGIPETVAAPVVATGSDSRSTDYSTTNVQVAGVDEADFLKNDGKYIYMKTDNNTIAIVDAFPASGMKLVSEIGFDKNSVPSQIYLNGDKLVVIGYQNDNSYGGPVPMYAASIGIMPPRYYSQKTFVSVYDISDRANPVLKRNSTMDGYYYNSRMVGDYVYMITNEPIRYYSDGDELVVPQVAYTKCLGGADSKCGSINVYHFNSQDTSYQFTIMSSINTKNDVEDVNSKVYMTGYSQNMYVSTDNIYMTYQKNLPQSYFIGKMVDAIISIVPGDVASQMQSIMATNETNDQKTNDVGKVLDKYSQTLSPDERLKFQNLGEEKIKNVMIEIQKEMEKTVIHRIAIKNGAIDYVINGEVPGVTLNQFSMDEYNSYLRIATTTGNTWDNTSKNNVYVLDSNLKVTGKVEDLAQGEKIYSVRFIGTRGYVVTFRQTDPLFVMDLSNPSAPVVAGQLKIPGFSSYLHPYDETHVLGVGQEANDQGRTQGLKLSLFDVTDPANPKEVSKYVGIKYSSSEAQYDHKAFLFSKEKNLVVLPVSWYDYTGNGTHFQGVYVFNVGIDSGFQLKGNITHEILTNGTSPFYYGNRNIQRSLYMDNVLYTVSPEEIRANDLGDLSKISNVTIPGYDYGGPIIVY